ncbi:hypothetical protein PFMC_05245, partial [Plasmodium falciparum CAMP/Malaysia]
MDSWEKAEKSKKKKTQICDAMKYSFADIGDIIRGRDILIFNNGNNEIERDLKAVFQSIYEKWKSDSNNNKDKYPDLTSFRSAWWDTNRKEIWKAMTCSAPEDATLFKKLENSEISNLVLSQHKCGYENDPPVDDYIPQPFRWLSEWSETYCLAQRDFLETMKNCENCKKNSGICKQSVHGACRDCKKKCEQYSQFVEHWKKQFELQNEAYKEIYTEATSNGVNPKGIDDNTKKFVQKLQENCQKNSVDTADKYLQRGSVCRRFKFGNNDPSDLNYAFHTEPPSHKEYCECAKDFDPLDECPVDKDECKKYGRYSCRKNHYNKNPIEWTNKFVKKHLKKYESVRVPPRRRKLCLSSISTHGREIRNEQNFKKYILHDASNEAAYLWDIHKNDPKKALTAMKYSFADYGNITKGDDLMDDLELVQKQLNEIFKQNSNGNEDVSEKRKKWWEKNKEKIWNVMMCHYNGSDKKKDTCPPHDNIDNEDQFLRWFQEWTENFCTKRKELYEDVQKICASAKCDTSNGSVDITQCIEACEKYKNYVLTKKTEYEIQKNKYDTEFKNKNSNAKDAPDYLKEKCNDNKCN